VAFGISLASTPFVKVIAQKIGAIDVPDARRVHTHPIPRMGGLAIFYGFLISVLCFSGFDAQLRGILIGSLIIVALGIVDDVKQLGAKIKFVTQIVVACIVVYHGIVIECLSVPTFINSSGYISLGVFSIPITILWIVGVTNAVNLIDGLDGLAVGVSSIATFSLFFIAILAGEMQVALLTAALAGGCLGFLPYNFNPAKIFMGDTGSTFLGYMLSIICIQGLFKGYVVISFIVPFLILGLPIFDTAFAIVRRIWNKKPIMAPDRGHLHHKLMDLGFSQKQTVAILYIVTSILALSAVVVLEIGAYTAVVFMLTVAAFGITAYKIYNINHKVRVDEDNGSASLEPQSEELVSNDDEQE
ncbi:MAG: undecaprenyl/decaprenyl-phosphate alpha-N-acetylglucosaminyl 1-phosphate transferase, partial [Clostridia bacterium]|nr:undecaprenyl/decaprenyl-phosphate alpha-N-acetylglucosaminyl 1-phosphate transferase [Clostridia bacterium]